MTGGLEALFENWLKLYGGSRSDDDLRILADQAYRYGVAAREGGGGTAKCLICGCEPMDGERHNQIVYEGAGSIQTECRVHRSNPTLPFHVVDVVNGANDTGDGADFWYHRRAGALFGG